MDGVTRIMVAILLGITIAHVFLVSDDTAESVTTPAVTAPAVNEYHAILRCEGLAEDSAAHVKLVEYGNGSIVYQCLKNGY